MNTLKKLDDYNPRCTPEDFNQSDASSESEPVAPKPQKQNKKPTNVGHCSFHKVFSRKLDDELLQDFKTKNKNGTTYVILRRVFHKGDNDLLNCYFKDDHNPIKVFGNAMVHGYFVCSQQLLKNWTAYDVHEIVPAEVPRRLFFDIDLETKKAEELQKNPEVCAWLENSFESTEEFVDLLRGKVTEAIRDCVSRLCEGLAVPEVAEFCVLNRNRAEKFSYHIIVPNYKVASCYQQKYFNEYLKKDFNIPAVMFEQNIIDLLHKANQSFAMPFAVSKGHKLAHNDEDEQNDDPRDYMVTLGTDENCKFMPVIERMDPRKPVRSFSNGPVSEENVKCAIEMFKKYLPEVAKSYEYSETKGDFINLKRVAPVNCPVCKRSHDGFQGDRAYLTRTPRKCGSIVDYRFGCNRKKDGEKTFHFHAALNFVIMSEDEDEVKGESEDEKAAETPKPVSKKEAAKKKLAIAAVIQQEAKQELTEAESEEKASNRKTKLQQKQEEIEGRKNAANALIVKRAELQAKWLKSDREGPVDFSRDSYTWSDFLEELKMKVFPDEFAAQEFIAEKSRSCAVMCDGGFYVKKDDCDHIYDFVPRGKMNLDLFSVNILNAGQRKPKLADYVEWFRSCAVIHNSPAPTQKYNVLNTWGRIKAQYHEEPNMELVQPWLDFIRKIWACDDETVFMWLLKWFKITCTMAEDKTNKAIFVFGKRGGEGKTMLADLIKMILGKKMAVEMNGLHQLLEKHETAVEGRKFICVNEIAEGREEMKGHFNQLKTYITDKELHINPKNQTPRDISNFANFMLISNHEDAIHIHPRRYMVIEISNHYALPENLVAARKFYKANVKQESADHFYSYLMNLDLDHIDIEEVPMTQAKIRAIERCKSNLEAFLADTQEDFMDDEKNASFSGVRLYVKGKETDETTYWINASGLHDKYSKWCERNKIKNVLGVRAFQAKLDSVFKTEKINRVLCYDLSIFKTANKIQPAQ